MKVYKTHLSSFHGTTDRIDGQPISVALDREGLPTVWFIAGTDPVGVTCVWTGKTTIVDCDQFIGTVVHPSGLTLHYFTSEAA